MIEIEQIDTNNLSDIKTELLSKISANNKVFCVSESPIERCVFLYERFANFSNTVEFVDSRSFKLSIVSDLPAKHAKYDLVQNQAWMIFSKNNLNVLDRECKLYECHGSTYVIQRFHIQLNTFDKGYIQFYSIPQKLRSEGVFFNKHSLLHVSIYNDQKCMSLNPSLISVKPSKKTVYIPLLPKQKLQVISSEKSNVVVSDDDVLKLTTTDKKSLCKGNVISSNIFTCQKFIEKNITVTVKVKKQFRTMIIPGMVLSDNGDLYAVIDEPLQNCGIYCHNLAGIMISNGRTKKNQLEWLYDDCVARISKNDFGVVIVFTNKQEYVTLSKSDEHWWLLNDTNCSLDSLS